MADGRGAALAALLIGGGLMLAVVGYHLPWYTHATAGFTQNAFDLAEWASIHPAVRSSSPPLLTSFLLRLPLVGLAAGLALLANALADERGRWVGRLLAAALLLRLVPPTEFFTDARDDPNYRQMLLLFVLGAALLAASSPARRLPGRFQQAAIVLVLLIAVGAGWWGLSRAGTLLDNFEIAVEIGAGAWGLTVGAVGVGLGLLISAWRAST